MTQPHGIFYWNELNTTKPEEAAKHYAALLGWHIETMPMGDGTDYHVAMLDGQPVAGIFDMRQHEDMKGMPEHWFSYIAVDDVDVSVEAFVAAGGAIKRPPFDVPGTGRIAILTDPVGAAVGLMTPEPMDG